MKKMCKDCIYCERLEFSKRPYWVRCCKYGLKVRANKNRDVCRGFKLK